jgi:hypothetical protein
MNRRNFVKGLSLAAGFLAVSGFDFKKKYTLYGDNKHDDSESIQAYLDGEDNVFYADGTKVTETLRSGTYKITHNPTNSAKDRFFVGSVVAQSPRSNSDKTRIIKNSDFMLYNDACLHIRARTFIKDCMFYKV